MTLPLSEIEGWVDEDKWVMENALRAMLELRAKKASIPAGYRGREMILVIKQDLYSESVTGSLSRLRYWFEVPGSAMYYKPTKVEPKVQSIWKAYQSHDRPRPLLWLSNGGRFIELQQEHGAAHL